MDGIRLMNPSEQIALLDRLRAEPHETEWLEFKANRFEHQLLGEYLSALANSAGLLGKPRAYLVFGIEDGTHTVAGTSFDPVAERARPRQPTVAVVAFAGVAAERRIRDSSVRLSGEASRVVRDQSSL